MLNGQVAPFGAADSALHEPPEHFFTVQSGVTLLQVVPFGALFGTQVPFKHESGSVQVVFRVLPHLVPFGLLVSARQRPLALHFSPFLQILDGEPQDVPAGSWFASHVPFRQVSGSLHEVSA